MSDTDKIQAINDKYKGKRTMKDLHELALEKAPYVLPGSSIRLTSDVKSLYLFNLEDGVYIGYLTAEPTALMFKKRPVSQISGPKGVLAEVQNLYKHK